MAITEKSVIDMINVREMGNIEIRRVDKVFQDDVEISKKYHRWMLMPNDDLTGQEPQVVAIAIAAWTPEVIAAYQAQVEAQRLA